VAFFIFKNIYCRYSTPGECIIHDRGSDFCNKVATILHDNFSTEIRIIQSNRPCANGQAESAVKRVKCKFKAGMLEMCNAESSNEKQSIAVFFFFF